METDLLSEGQILRPYKLDKEFEYGELSFTFVEINLMQENAKLFPTMTEDDPRRRKIEQLLTYYDIYLPSEGWQCYEIARPEGKPIEIRRFKRPRKLNWLQNLKKKLAGV